MSWDVLLERDEFILRRRGKVVVAELTTPSRVLNTSVQHGGYSGHVRYLVNHQSCEAAGHHDFHRVITESGWEGYHRLVCSEASLPADQAVVMGTAANMNYTAVCTATDLTLAVTAVVTAGVEGNATCAGDPAAWRETDAGMEKVPVHAGTINTMLLISAPLTDAALARAVITMTEGKSAALQRLAVPSRQSPDVATGTGTDQYCIAVPTRPGGALTSASPHVKLGELIGRTVRDATQEALRWQNGLEPSYTRGVFHALGRYGLKEATFFEDIAPYLEAADLELLKKNNRAVTYEPLVGAAAHALAAVLDRVRHGSVPSSVQREASIQLAATLAANVAANPDRWPDFRARLHQLVAAETGTDSVPKTLVLAALALGWSEKWRSSL